jgi:hypothetical protein
MAFRGTNQNQILLFVLEQFLTKRNSKEIWQDVVLKPRPSLNPQHFMIPITQKTCLIWWLIAIIFEEDTQKEQSLVGTSAISYHTLSCGHIF